MKLILVSLLAISLVLTGCFETTQEITLNEDGSGTISTTSDLSAVIALSKNMGGGEGMENIPKVDSSISLAPLADSMENINAEEKELLRKGKMDMNINIKANVFYTKLSFPLSKPGDIEAVNKLTSKVFGAAMKKQMKESPLAGATGGELPDIRSFDEYYELDFEKGELKKSLNKDKYAGAKDDEYLKGMKEAAGMGIPVTATYIINLPRPATKTEGKNIVLSGDKMKVTVKVDIDDFFDNPEKLEFKIKY